ncbi:Peroxisome size and maintenance regulator [Pseudogymnoascus australis]
MDEYTNGAFVNRDGRVPVIRLDSPSSQSEASHDLPGNENKGKGHSIRSKLGDRARKMVGRAGDNKGDNGDKAGKGDKGPSMQDRLLEKLLQQIIPVEDQPRNQEGSPYSNRIERPAFSLPTMSTNFRRFNSRIGVVFVFQARVIRLLSWRKYSHTISLLAVYTFVCLDPHLLTVLPLAGLLLGVFIPSFIARHPAPR